MASKRFLPWGRLLLGKTKLGYLFLFLLGVVCIFTVLNWMSIRYHRRDVSFLDHENHSHWGWKQQNSKDEQVCKVPNLSLKTGAIRHGYREMPKLNCKGKHIFYLEDSVLRINRTVLGESKINRCVYRAVERINDRRFTFSQPLIKTDNFEIRVKNDFFLVECCMTTSHKENDNKQHLHDDKYGLPVRKPDEIDLSQNKPLEHKLEACRPQVDQFFAQIHRKHDVLERIASTKPFVNSTKLNVLMFALDSMSHLAYQRYLPKTYAYLKDTLKAVILHAYTVVGDGTTPNIIPMLTGMTEKDLPDVRLRKNGSNYVDIYPLIWKQFEQSGYVTLFSEDDPGLSTFQLRLKGFKEEPVDHYMRHFWQAIEGSELHRRSAKYCLGPKPKHQFALDHLKDFFVKYQSVPKFAFTFLVELSHNDNNPSRYVDTDLKDFLKFMRLNGHLDNTLLFVMADHGARYSNARKTLQGKLEERLPMMSLVLPDKFKKQYPHLMENLQENKIRLATPFDIHETLKTVLNIYNAEKPVTYRDRGISLLNRIPANRTCDSAGIAIHWCTCMQQRELDTKDKKVKQAAAYMMSHINQKIDSVKDLCSTLSLKRIHNAVQVVPNEKVMKYTRSIDKDHSVPGFGKAVQDITHYQLTIETTPNNGFYEGTIQIIVADNSLSVIGDISRINRYGDQPHCIMATLPELRKYCLCTKPKKN